MKYTILAVSVLFATAIHAEPPITEPVDANVVNTPDVRVANVVEFGDLDAAVFVSGNAPGSTGFAPVQGSKVKIHTANLSVGATGGDCYVRLSVQRFIDLGTVIDEKRLLSVVAVDGNNSSAVSYPSPVVVEVDPAMGEKIRIAQLTSTFSSGSPKCYQTGAVTYEILEE